MDDLPPGFDESKFEQAMEQLARRRMAWTMKILAKRRA